jgi:hypothetical protein
MKSFTFKTGDEAWVSINKLFIEQDENLGLFKEGQGASITNSLFTYGITVLIEEAKFDPEFDFGKIFGYTQSKWSSLLNNYVDLDALDKLKLQIRELEKNKAVNRNYHIGFNFADSHGNGKGCLVSGIFSRMIFIEKPRLSIVMRASDVVTRLPWDILLAVRLGEYVYGHTDFTIELIIRSAFADDFSLMLFNGYEPIEPLIDGIENETRKKRLRKVLRKVKKAADKGTDPGYQAYMRVYKIYNPEKYGKKPKSFLAKDCIIGNWDGIPLPEQCPSILVRNRIKDAYLKFIKRYDLKMFNDFDKSKKLIKFKEQDGSITDKPLDDMDFDDFDDNPMLEEENNKE